MTSATSTARFRALLGADYRFAVIAAMILAVEAIAILVSSPGHIIGVDGISYELYARNLVDHGVYSYSAAPPFAPSIYRTPGYPLFLAGLRLIAGNSILIVRITQFLLLGATAAMGYGIGFALRGRRAARITSLICITYLPFLWLARMHLTETVATTVLTAVVLLLIRSRTNPRLWHYAAVGALVAFAALIRPGYSLLVVAIAFGLLLWRGPVPLRTAFLRVAVLGAAFAVALVPWTIRNLNVTHQIRPFGVGGGGLSLFASAQQYAGTGGYRFDAEQLQQLDAATAPIIHRADQRAARENTEVPLKIREEIAEDQALRSAARNIIKHVSVGDILRRVPKRVAYLWAVSDYPGSAHYSFWHNVARAEHLALLALALLGFFITATSVGLAATWPLVLLPLYITTAHLVTHSEGRYSVPARSSLAVLAALAVTYLWTRWRRAQDHPHAAIGCEHEPSGGATLTGAVQ